MSGPPCFRVVIVGAGLGGLATAIAMAKKGFQVQVLEGAPQLAEVGAGIQVPPNSTKILADWGLFERFSKIVTWPSAINMRRYSSGAVIGDTPLAPRMTERYGYPYWLIHRADYQSLLYDAAVEAGADVILNCRVVSIDAEAVSVVAEDGRTFLADLIVGADGIRSIVRHDAIPGADVAPEASSNCAYRATVPRELMMKDPQTADLMLNPNANCWIGPGRHIMSYPIRNGKLYNLVMSHPGKAAVDKWNEPGNLDEMRKHYEDYDPAIRKVLNLVESCLKWKLAELPPLPRWTSNNGRVALIGDAAHAMLPYLAQGAAQSIEDGVVLAECLERARATKDIPFLTSTYESIRKPRCEKIQKGANENGTIWHLPDGSDQQLRDHAMAMTEDTSEARSGEKQQSNPNQWSDENFQPWLFGYDAKLQVKFTLDSHLNSARI